MITDFGKTIDPIADKLTQGAILFCLLTRFSLMWMLIGLMAVKEAVCLTLRAWLFKKTELIHGAEWHGKLNTSLLYATMCLHVIWYTIPPVVSVVTICIATAMMLLSFVLYVISTMQYWKEYKDQNA
jgi:cardiolipin synthase